MAHEWPAHEPSKNLQIFPLGRFLMLAPAAHDDTSGYDSRSRTAVSLVGAGPADSKVNNAPFCHTSCHSEVSLAARLGTLPQRVKNANRLTARLKHL